MTTSQPILGAIMAGGAASRFGSDKALALFEGRPLIDHVAQALADQAAAVIVVGRTHGTLTSVADRPAPGIGPLGALAGALAWARNHGFAAVLSAPCDVPLLPADLARRLAGEGPAYVEGLPVVGHWPSSLADHLQDWLAGARMQDRKKEKLQPEFWREWERRTSFWPFAAIAAKRARIGRIGGHALGGGSVVWLAATWAHIPLSGWPAGIWRWIG